MSALSSQAPTATFQSIGYTGMRWTKTIWELPVPLIQTVSSEQLRSPVYWIQTAAKVAIIPFLMVAAFEALINVAIAFHNHISVPLANKIVTWLHSKEGPKVDAAAAVPEATIEEEEELPTDFVATEDPDADDEIASQASIAEQLSESEANELRVYLESDPEEGSGEDLAQEKQSSGSGSLVESPRNSSEEEQKIAQHERDPSLGEVLPGEEIELGKEINQSLDQMRQSQYFPDPAKQSPASSWWPFGGKKT